jgi:polyferredoxin
MPNNHSAKSADSGWKNFLSATTQLCGFAALSGLLIGIIVMFAGGFKGVVDPQYFFGLKNWYEGLLAGALIGLIAPAIFCATVAFLVACGTETGIYLNSRLTKKA